MSAFTLLISEAAKLDIKEAYNWYEDQKLNLGVQLIEKLNEAFQYIQNNPKKIQVRYKDIRVQLVRKFPFGIHFYIRKNQLIVIGVIHLSREPRNWKRI